MARTGMLTRPAAGVPARAGDGGGPGQRASRVAFALGGLLLMACLLCAALPATAQERRVALVVGVGGYRHAPALLNPLNDARDIAAALGRLGFEAETLIDPDRLALEAGARRFGQRARGADAALFFFAGHALEASGRNWLLPAPAEIRSDRDMRFEALDLDGVLEQLEGAARLSILILDACRDNPFRQRLQSASRSVTPAPELGQLNAAVGTLLAFATAPGTVAEDGGGRNSLFTTALLRRIETPGLEIRQLMAEVRREVRQETKGRQVPWETSAQEGSFYFRATPPSAPSAAASPPAAAETVFWESVRASRNAADFRAYLARFPDGVFVPLARNRLAELEGRQRPPETRLPDPNAVLDPATPEGREALLQRVFSLVQPISAARLEMQVQSLRAFRESQQHRAFAVAPGRQNSFRVAAVPSAAAAAARMGLPLPSWMQPGRLEMSLQKRRARRAAMPQSRPVAGLAGGSGPAGVAPQDETPQNGSEAPALRTLHHPQFP